MKRKTLGYILLISGILITIYGYFYHEREIVYMCPAFGCNFNAQQLAEMKAVHDNANNIRYTIIGVGISISIIGIVILVRSGEFA